MTPIALASPLMLFVSRAIPTDLRPSLVMPTPGSGIQHRTAAKGRA